jgi:hypothetical protein
MKFFCSNCNQEFETNNPSKKEYRDYLLGPCWKYISNCPSCEQECDEKRIPKPQKSSMSFASQIPSCGGNCDSCGI